MDQNLPFSILPLIFSGDSTGRAVGILWLLRILPSNSCMDGGSAEAQPGIGVGAVGGALSAQSDRVFLGNSEGASGDPPYLVRDP